MGRKWRAAQADVRVRYVVNFRIDPDLARAMLPVPWLDPQIVRGHAVLSFCPYVLDAVRLSPLPRSLGVRAICSAYRLAVVDRSGSTPVAAAWVPARETNDRFVARLAPGSLRAGFERLVASVTDDPDGTRISFTRLDHRPYFHARFNPADQPGGELFVDVAAFEGFFKAAATSWAPSTTEGSWVRLDLDAGETNYAPLAITDLDAPGLPGDAVFDSAFVGRGGSYCWSCTDLRTT